MKSLIKSNDWLDIGEVHAVDWSGLGHIQVDGAVPARSASPSAPEKRESELEALRKALAEADARHKEEIVRKSEQARLEAAAQHRRDDEAALAALSQELTRASDETLQRFASAEHLALMMCE